MIFINVQLHVSDESLAFLTELGFTVKEATRALRISSQIVDRAIDFATEERKKELKRREEDKQYAQQRR
jgi:predicted lactoylglutathione lyase